MKQQHNVESMHSAEMVSMEALEAVASQKMTTMVSATPPFLAALIFGTRRYSSR